MFHPTGRKWTSQLGMLGLSAQEAQDTWALVRVTTFDRKKVSHIIDVCCPRNGIVLVSGNELVLLRMDYDIKNKQN